jgi:excisionase family DNA binding protein
MAARKVRPINPDQRYCSPRQASALLGVSEYLVYRECIAGTIPHRRLGQRILIPVEWVLGEAG